MNETESLCFGYGSLVNLNTHEFQSAGLSELSGWRRAWCHRIDRQDRRVTSLSILPDEDASTYGLLLQVDASQQPSLDARERGYNRVDLNKTNFNSPQSGGGIYTYVSATAANGDGNFPILQSYLDTVLKGFFDVMGDDGLTHFLKTTSGWEAPILNDRANPIYPRSQTLPMDFTDEIDKRLGKLGAVYLSSSAAE